MSFAAVETGTLWAKIKLELATNFAQKTNKQTKKNMHVVCGLGAFIPMEQTCILKIVFCMFC